MDAYVSPTGTTHTRECGTVRHHRGGGDRRGASPTLKLITFGEAIDRIARFGGECGTCARMRTSARAALCGCGMLVADHSRPLAAATRAYATSGAEGWPAKHAAAEAAYRDAVPSWKAYNIGDATDAAYHAHQYALPPAGDDVHMVRVTGGHLYAVDLMVTQSDRGVMAKFLYDGRATDVSSYGTQLDDPPARLRSLLPRFQADGYVVAHDWRS